MSENTTRYFLVMIDKVVIGATESDGRLKMYVRRIPEPDETEEQSKEAVCTQCVEAARRTYDGAIGEVTARPLTKEAYETGLIMSRPLAQKQKLN